MSLFFAGTLGVLLKQLQLYVFIRSGWVYFFRSGPAGRIGRRNGICEEPWALNAGSVCRLLLGPVEPDLPELFVQPGYFGFGIGGKGQTTVAAVDADEFHDGFARRGCRRRD